MIHDRHMVLAYVLVLVVMRWRCGRLGEGEKSGNTLWIVENHREIAIWKSGSYVFYFFSKSERLLW